MSQNTFVGHPLLEQEAKNKIDLSTSYQIIRKIISLFLVVDHPKPNLPLPVLIDFIKWWIKI